MSAIDLENVRAALRDPVREIAGTDETRRAAVSAILRDGERGLEVMLIRRAERASDPWSGHMAFPGGRSEEADRDLRATAVRETLEEVGIDLEIHGQLVGRLDDVIPGSSRGLETRLVVSPFVWWMRTVPELVPNGVEVDEIHWAELAPLMRGDRDTTFPYVWKGQAMSFPGFRVGSGETERVVWGMTHRMLETLFARLRAVLDRDRAKRYALRRGLIYTRARSMDEQRYLDLAHETFRTIVDAFDGVDVEDADVDTSGDVITIAWGRGGKCVVNTQRPVRQIWLAGGDRAWHFGWDEARRIWIDDKGTGAELLATIAEIARARGVEIGGAR